MSPWSTLKAEVVVFTAFCCKPVPMAVGYSEEAKRLAATGLIIAAGILLNGNGGRVAAAGEEEVHGAVKDTHGLYSCPAPVQTPVTSKPFAQRAPKSPLRSAAV